MEFVALKWISATTSVLIKPRTEFNVKSMKREDILKPKTMFLADRFKNIFDRRPSY